MAIVSTDCFNTQLFYNVIWDLCEMRLFSREREREKKNCNNHNHRNDKKSINLVNSVLRALSCMNIEQIFLIGLNWPIFSCSHGIDNAYSKFEMKTNNSISLSLNWNLWKTNCYTFSTKIRDKVVSQFPIRMRVIRYVVRGTTFLRRIVCLLSVQCSVV